MRDMLELTELTGIATLQDSGRRGFEKFGVPASGPMDWFAYQAANSLLDNLPNSAVIELGLGELTLRALRNTSLSVTGSGYEVESYLWTFPLWTSFYVRAGWTVRVKKTGGGNWAYISIAGGFNSPVVMNSRSTYLRGGIGPALKIGDVLAPANPPADLLKLAARNFSGAGFMPYSQTPFIDVIRAPQADWFTPEGICAFYENEYIVSLPFDRMGYRLQTLAPSSPTNTITKKNARELISEGMMMGSIQIPADGRPIVMMADSPTAGGYPKIAHVTRASLPLLAQCEAGAGKIRFRETTVEEAQENRKKISMVFKTPQDWKRMK
ncbi:MAG: biotin-dependent carboxyltransferase family protein [Chloroflexi bacterium CFX1]|nr:biotin-dependent carboxyltransferase family protein [Chloroflexi bacterium CFX1]MCQ3954883.1 KipI antagonist [Chloroflexota bacterium]MDL1919575.1 biotin-dependent carboxyltransferase family protein [Chloroflexi bacterium CFX5]